MNREQGLMRRRAILDSKPYIELEAIELTGTQYFMLGQYLTADSVFEMTIECEELTYGTTIALFGSRTLASSATNNCSIFYSSKTQWADWIFMTFLSTYTTSITGLPRQDGIMAIRLEYGLFTMNNDTYYLNSSENYNESTLQTLVLGTINTNGVIDDRCFIGKIKAYKHSLSDGTIIQNLIPVQLDTGEIGLWDSISNNFHSNSGTGEFIPHYKN